MTLSPVVAFTVHNRPRYLAEALESWSKVRGIEHSRLLFFCEPGCPEAVDLCADADFAADITATVNDRRRGVLGNPWRALDYAFAGGADFAILAEEDLIVSPDVLEYFAWSQRYRDDPGALGVTTYQHDERPGGLAGAGTADWSRDDAWHFWVWGTWRDRWATLIRDDWDFTYRENGGGPAQRGWDWRLRNKLVLGNGMKMIAPSLCRSQHIGQYGGVHCQPWDFERLLSPSFAGLDVPPQDYQEVGLAAGSAATRM